MTSGMTRQKCERWERARGLLKRVCTQFIVNMLCIAVSMNERYKEMGVCGIVDRIRTAVVWWWR